MRPTPYPYIDDLSDEELYVLSTIGQGPKGEKGDSGDPTQEQVKAALEAIIAEHPEYVTTVEDHSITTIKLADDAVTHNKMAVRSVGTDELIDGSVTTPKLAGGAVTTTKLANESVTYDKVKASTFPSMSAAKRGIAKVGAGLAMNGDALELDGSGDIATAVTTWLDAHPEATTTVQDGAISTAKLADEAVTDDKLYGYGVRHSIEVVDDKVSDISMLSRGNIPMSNTIDLNTALGKDSLFIEWIQLKLLDSTAVGDTTGCLCIPCRPDSTYTFFSSTTRPRFVIGCTDIFPQVGMSVSCVSTNHGANTISINTDSTAKYILLYYWISTIDTIPLVDAFNGLSCYGPVQHVTEAIDDISDMVSGMGISLSDADDLNQVLGYQSLMIEWVQYRLYDTVVADDSTGILCIPCKPDSTYTFYSANPRPRFVVGCSPMYPWVNCSFTTVNNNNDGGTSVSITTDPDSAYITLFFWISSKDTESLASARAGLSCVGPRLTAIDLIARQAIERKTAMRDTVVVSPDGEYTTITSGIAAVPDGGTVIVTPGTYVEQIDTKSKEVHIVGIDKHSCILKDTSGMYDTPPIEISSGSISNMTIIETSEDSTPSSPGSNPTLAYCVHADWDQMLGKTLTISDCILMCCKRAAIGCGVRPGFVLNVMNCQIWSGVQEDTAHQPRGAVYVHTGTGVGIDAEVNLSNNEINCDDSIALCLQKAAGKDVGFSVKSINNMVYSSINGKDPSVVDDGSQSAFSWNTYITRDPRSFGNNITLLDE